MVIPRGENAPQETPTLVLPNAVIRRAATMSHNTTPWSWVPAASVLPSGEKATELAWHGTQANSFPVFTSHRRIIGSELRPNPSVFPSEVLVTQALAP